MIAPDLFKIKPPREHVQCSLIDAHSPDVNNTIKKHFFNHSVVAIFPDTMQVPPEFKNILVNDAEYYLLEDFPLHFLAEYQFIDAFIGKGELTLLSIDTLLDVDVCCCVTPNGYLVLSVPRDVFLRLGIEKGPAVNVISFKNNSRYLITINLIHSAFKPDKNNYIRVYNQLCLSKIAMNVIISWEPRDIKVCPSSIASYFSKKGVSCEECSPFYSERRFYDVNVPNFTSSTDQLFEWLGLFLLDSIESRKGEETEYLSSYWPPEESDTVGQVLVFQQTGLISTTRIIKLWNAIRSYIATRSSIPWIGLHIHGFEDSPVTWNLDPHRHSVFGDNNYSLICDRKGSIKTCKVFTSLKCRD